MLKESPSMLKESVFSESSSLFTDTFFSLSFTIIFMSFSVRVNPQMYFDFHESGCIFLFINLQIRKLCPKFGPESKV